MVEGDFFDVRVVLLLKGVFFSICEWGLEGFFCFLCPLSDLGEMCFGFFRFSPFFLWGMVSGAGISVSFYTLVTLYFLFFYLW